MGFKIIVNENVVKFSACHFLAEHEKCSRIHGHNYYVSVEISDNLDENYFVVDFMDLKKVIQEIIEPLDHYILVPTASKQFQIKESENMIEVITPKKRYLFPREDVCLLPLPATTSELLAKYIYDKLKERYSNKTIIVRVGESRSSVASYSE